MSGVKIDKTTKDRLLEAAKDILSNAYAPYSNCRVAAAVVDNKENIYTGVNVENASFGLTVCAERNAIAAMVKAGGKRIEAILIISNIGAIPPCGACRQVIAEFAEERVPIFLADDSGILEEWTLGGLLPRIYRPDKWLFTNSKSSGKSISSQK